MMVVLLSLLVIMFKIHPNCLNTSYRCLIVVSKMGKLLQKLFHPEIYYGFSPEHSQKNSRKARNHRYYVRHIDEFRKRRKEYYGLYGK